MEHLLHFLQRLHLLHRQGLWSLLCWSLLSRRSSISLSGSSVSCWLRRGSPLGWGVVTLGWWVVRGVVHEEFPVDETEDNETNDRAGYDGLEVLHPELVLHCSCLLLKLSAAVLKGISSLLQVSQLPVPLQDVLHVGVHDPDDLLDLGLLLGHLPGGLDLSDLSRSRDWLPVRTQGPCGGFLAWGGHGSVWGLLVLNTVGLC